MFNAREWQRNWRAKNPDKIALYNARNREKKREQWKNDPIYRAASAANRRKWQKENREYKNKYMREWYAKNPDAQNKRRARSIEHQRKLRADVFEAYGNRCACCGDTHQEFFTMDHINGRKGVAHRKRLTGWQLYSWLKKNNFPKIDFRLLCFNCNCARGAFGYCPHEREPR